MSHNCNECGKAMKAAMIAVMSSGMIYSKVDDTDSTKDIMTRLNRSVHLKTDDMMFTSLCLASLDTQTKEFTYTIAGINEPLLKSNGAVVSLEGVGRCLPLGIVDDNVYEERKVPLQANDVLVLFTDGIPDARNNSKEFYGEKTLLDLLDRMETSTLSAKEIKERIIADVKHFYGNAPQHDDMTIIVVKSA